MADWEEAPMKVTEGNVRQFAGLKDGYATGGMEPTEDIQKELQQLKLQLAQYKSNDGWEDAPNGAPSGRSTVDSDGWEDAPQQTSFKDKALGVGETALSMLTGGVGMVGGGLAAIPVTLAGGLDAGAAVSKSVADTLTYSPKTGAGKEFNEASGEWMREQVEKGKPATVQMIKDLPFNITDDQAEMVGAIVNELGSNFIPVELMGAAARAKAGKASPSAAEAARKLGDSPRTEPSMTAVETPLPTLDMEGVAPHMGNPDVIGAVPETPLPELNMWDGSQTKGFPKIDESIEGAPRIQNETVPVLEDPLSPESRARREQVDTEGRFQNQEDFNQPLDNGLTEQYMKAQEEAFYKEQQAQEKSVKEQAFKEAESLKEKQLVEMEAQRQLDLARQAGELDFLELQRNGDKSLMNERGTAFMFESIQGGSLKAAITDLAGLHPDAGYRALARYLEPMVEGIKAKLHDVSVIISGERGYTGYFDNTSNTVGFSRQGAVSPHTVLHETVHALTSQYLITRPNAMLSKGMRTLFEKTKGQKGFGKFPSIINEREFVAEAFSNPDFQKFLKQQQVTPHGPVRTAWSKFVQTVKSMLGIKEPKMATALDHTIDLGKQIMERSTESFRNQAKEQLKASGVPNKLVDLMAKKGPPKLTRNDPEPLRKLPVLKNTIEDFAFYNKTPEEVVELAKAGTDIPNKMSDKVMDQIQAGGLFKSLDTRNPVVKDTYERITRAFQNAAEKVRVNLLDRETGLKEYMRDLDADQKGWIWGRMRIDEGQIARTGEELASMGFNEKQIGFYQRYRELSVKFFEELNARRAEMGLRPMDWRVAHLAGSFMGDFRVLGYKDGKVKAFVGGSTKWEANKARKWMEEHHPELEWGLPEYNKIGKGKSAADRFSGLMEAINFMEKADADVMVLMDSYREYLKSDAVNFLNATKHAKAKVKDAGGILGSEGNKPWESARKNAEQGMKAQLAYFEQGYTWMEMQKAVGDIAKVTGDETVALNMPNAVKWANQYRDHALGIKQGWMADAANGMLSFIGENTGFGHSNILKVSNEAKHRMMQKFMGFYNIPFTITQLMQPVQTHPAMITHLKNRGLEFSVATSQVKAMETYLASLHRPLLAKASAFDKQLVEYADKYGIFDVKLSDHTKDINVGPIKENFDRYVGDINISAPEHFTRGNAFFFYSHLLKEAGIPAKDIFGAAENMTNFTMTNYHHIERPRMYSRMGWLGDVASTLTRYKHNQLSQMAFYGREAVRPEAGIKASAPLAIFLGSALAFGGVTGMFAYNEADVLFQLFSEKVLKKPNNLTNVILKSDMPEVLSHGVGAALGLDMSSRFSHAKTIPENPAQFLMPYGSALWDMGVTALDLAKNRDEVGFNRAVKAWMPSSVQGHVENELFTQKQPDGSNMYINPRTLEGRVKRTDEQMSTRAWGFRTMSESKETAGNYSDFQIKQGYTNLREKVLEKAKRLYTTGDLTPAKARELAQEYMKYEGMNLGGALSQFAINQRTTEIQRQLLNGSIFDKQRAQARVNATK